MKYGDLTLDQIERVVDRLGGIDGVRHFLSDRFIRTKAIGDLSSWATITLGNLPKTVRGFYTAFALKGIKLDACARDMIDSPRLILTPHKTEVDLVIVTVMELGVTGAPTRSAIFKRALDAGLQVCPSEVGLALPLDLDHAQTGVEAVHIGMHGIVLPDRSNCCFSIARDQARGYHICGVDHCCQDRLYSPLDLFVFVKPTKI